MKAIETVYRGFRFRSRLEARWAVFFDALGLAWEYEKEGYDLDEAGWYLPDFWLPQVRMWAEVKPDGLSSEELNALGAKGRKLAECTNSPVLLLIGMPENKPYQAIEPQTDEEFEPVDYCLTMYHNYPIDEHRFYCSPGDHGPGGDAYWEDTERAAIAAKQARFEHGEDPAVVVAKARGDIRVRQTASAKSLAGWQSPDRTARIPESPKFAPAVPDKKAVEAIQALADLRGELPHEAVALAFPHLIEVLLSSSRFIQAACLRSVRQVENTEQGNIRLLFGHDFARKTAAKPENATIICEAVGRLIGQSVHLEFEMIEPRKAA